MILRSLARAALVGVALAAFRLPAGATAAETVAMAARVAPPLALDATLADARWASARRTLDLTDATTRGPGRMKTDVAVLYDDQNLYLGFWNAQSVPITSVQSTNNIGFGTDDYVAIGIDPTGNFDRAYLFAITPRGTRYQQSSENARYQPPWQGAAAQYDGGWSAMLVIPFEVLRLSGAAKQTWHVNLFRFVAADSEKLISAFDGRMDLGGFPSLADARYWTTSYDLQIAPRAFKAKPAVALYALESGGAGRAQFVSPGGQPFVKNPHVTGADLEYPLTPTMKFVGAVYPDFSNVDADQLTITPQVFRRNLNEYRPFFTQGAGFINNSATALGVNEAPHTTFYSPSIGAFDRGYKVEGTYGKYQSLGLLDVHGADPVSGAPFDDFAFGWKHVLQGRTFGYWVNGAVANHAGVRDEAAQFGVQARDLRTGWVGALFHERESGTLVTNQGMGLSSYGFLDHQNGNHEVNLSYTDVGPLYNPLDGFVQINDVRGPGVFVNLFGSGPPNSSLKNGFLGFYGSRYLDHSGAVHKADLGFNANADMKGNYSLNFGSDQTELRTYDGNFLNGWPFYRNPRTQRFDFSYAGATYRPNSPSPINVQYAWGPFGDFFLQQTTSGFTRALGTRFTVGFEYDGTRERFYRGAADGQWLRRASLGWSIDRDTTLSFALRNISGNGGFALPGTNLSASFHRLMPGGDDFYVGFGTPAANQTIDRVLIKYVMKFGTNATNR